MIRQTDKRNEWYARDSWNECKTILARYT